MSGDWREKFAELRHMTRIGEGVIHCQVIMDQVYAHYQHERLDLRHPHGGHARYLATPLFTRYPKYLADYARSFTTDGGIRSLERSMEDLSDQAGWHAPYEFGDLAASGHPMVRIGDHIEYDRPPKQHRLTEAELRIKNRLRHLPPELIGWIWWHVMHRTSPPPRHGR